MPWAGNIAKTMTSNGKRLTVTHELLTAVARDQRWPDVVAGIIVNGGDINYAGMSARFSKFASVLFSYITNHWMTGPLGNSEICFPLIQRRSRRNIQIRVKQNSLFPSGPVIKC